MKKIGIVILKGILAGSIGLTAIVGGFCSCEVVETTLQVKKRAAERLGLDFSESIVLEEWDSHGGFHGDGEAFVKLSVPDDFEVQLKGNEGWNAFPLTGEPYAYYYEWGGTFGTLEKGEKVIPEIENGYWYFENTGPMNWDFAAFDKDMGIFYYYEWDA